MAGSQMVAVAGEAGSAQGKRRATALFVVMLAVAMDLVDASAVNVALPSLRAGFHMSGSGLQWVVAGYSLSFAAMLLTGGRLGDVLGYRRTFLIGTAGFTTASLACALAPATAFLIAARVAQGTAAAFMVPQATSLLQLLYRPEERSRVMGLFGALAGLAAASGPVVGGVILKADLPGADWRPIFLLNVPVGAVALVAAALLLPDGRSPEPTRLDIRGSCLVVAGLSLLTLPLIQGPDLHWPPWTVVCLAGSAPVLLFAVHDQRTRPGAALVAKGLFSQRTFVSGLSLSLLVNAVMGGMVLSTTYTLQEGLGLSAVRAALTTLPMIVGMVFGVGVLAEFLIPRLGRYVITLGSGILAAGVLASAWILHRHGHSTQVWQLAPGLLVTGVGLGSLMGPLFAITLQHATIAQTGSASGALESIQQFGGALGVVFVGGVFLHRADAGGSLGAFTWAAGSALLLLAVIAMGAQFVPRHFRNDKELTSGS